MAQASTAIYLSSVNQRMKLATVYTLLFGILGLSSSLGAQSLDTLTVKIRLVDTDKKPVAQFPFGVDFNSTKPCIYHR